MQAAHETRGLLREMAYVQSRVFVLHGWTLFGAAMRIYDGFGGCMYRSRSTSAFV